MSESLKQGYLEHPERKQKISIKKKGQKHTEESKKLIARGNQKKVKVKFKNGEEIIFDSRNNCIKYFYDNYNIGIYTIKKLLRTGEVLNSKYKKFKELNGLSIYYINQ